MFSVKVSGMLRGRREMPWHPSASRQQASKLRAENNVQKPLPEAVTGCVLAWAIVLATSTHPVGGLYPRRAIQADIGSLLSARSKPSAGSSAWLKMSTRAWPKQPHTQCPSENGRGCYHT